MAKIFEKEASQQDFDLIVQQLREATTIADMGQFTQGSIGKEIDEIDHKAEISESQFAKIADESDGFLEDSPWRLTVPEIRYLRNQVSHFGDLATVLSKYGYSEAKLFKSLAQNNPGRFDTAAKIISQHVFQPDFQLTDLSPELRGDKHFMIALIQGKSDFYDQLSFEEQSDPDYAVQYVCSKLVAHESVTQRGLFDSVPDILRFDSTFLQKCRDDVNLFIPPTNFDYLWLEKNETGIGRFLYLAIPESPLENFDFWVEFYNGDKEQAFKATVNGKNITYDYDNLDDAGQAKKIVKNIIPRDVLKNDFLTRPDASLFYDKLPQELKADEELARIALKQDPKTFSYLPPDSKLLKEPETWFMAAGVDGTYNYYGHPDFPKELLNNSDLVNTIVAAHPELLYTYREQPEELKQILSQLTPENVTAFVGFYVEVFNLLPEKLKHDLNFAKKMVDFKSNSEATNKLFWIHGAELVDYAIFKYPEIIYWIPKYVLSLPTMDQIVREQISAPQEKKMPYWFHGYFEDHPDQVPGLIESKPDWFEELLEYYLPSDTSKKDLPLQIAKTHFDSFVTTPKRMTVYLKAFPDNKEQTMNEGLVDAVRSALIKYSGEINNDVSRYAESAAFTAVGGEYENKHPEFPEDIIRLLLNKYHVAPSGLDGEKIISNLSFENKNDLLILLENSHHALPNECIAKIYDSIKNDPDLIYKAAKIDVRILQLVSEKEWKKLGPDLVTHIDGDLTLLASTYSLLPEDLRSDKSLALRAVVADSDNYFYLPKFLLQDQAFVTELCGWASVPAYDLGEMSPSAQVASSARFPSTFHLVEPALRNTQKFQQDCLAQNIWLFNELTADEQVQAWPGFKKQLTQNGFLYTEVNSWDDFVAILRTKSVSPKRIRSLDGWKLACPDLFSATAKSQGGDDHRVLILISKEDWNGAFTSVPIVDRLAALGIQNVDYREVGSESDVKRILADAKSSGTAYDEIFIAGHGTQNSLALGGEDRARNETLAIKDDMYVDFSDFDDGDYDFASVLKKGGRLIDLSCSNGEGADKADNLANRFATTLTKDQTVVASQVITNIEYMDKDPSGHIHVYWMENTPYLVQGKK